MTPVQANALAQRGIALHQQGRTDEAIAALAKAARGRPEVATLHSLLGTALASGGRMAEAARCFATATKLAPDCLDHHANLGRALMAQGALGPAIDALTAAAALDGGTAARFRLATALQSAQRFDEAEVVYRAILDQSPEHLGARNDLGLALQALGRRDEAIGCFRAAIAIDADYAGAHWNLALALLAQGDYPEGWREYEWRWRGGIPNLVPRHLPRPEWRGEDLAGRTILLHAEQGFGDTIQFARYAGPLAKRGATVLMVVQEPLVRLLATVPGLAQVIASGAPLPEFDCHLPLLSVPRVIGTVATTIPAELPMMAADPAAIEAWRRRLAPLPRPWVGLAWAGDPKNGTDRLRSLGADDLAALLALPGISWISLQKGAAAPAGMADPTAALTDFADTAALVANLDLVVSVDTAVAHLAGALAKPVWILLRANGDWRWGLEGETTRWYPTARLFRQSVPGRWEDVVATLADLTKVLFPVPKMTYPRQIDQVQKVRAVARRMNRLGVVDTWTRVLGVVAVLINVFAWALVGIPSASAEDVATLYDAAEICHAAPAHGPADDSQPSHQLCPQCFPLGGHCGAAFVPLATQGTVAVIALGRIATEDPPRLIAAARPFRQRARGPPAQV